MTREEAISLLTQVNKILVNSSSWLENTHEPLNMAFDMAIKALEQEPRSEWEQDHAILKAYSDGANEVLDKIRAEIIQSIQNGTIKIEDGSRELFCILDKYKIESEVEDGNE